MPRPELPIPPLFDPSQVAELWRVDYQATARLASEWRKRYSIPPAVQDEDRTILLLIDLQNTFCIPGFELFVAGRSGLGAVEDNRRLCEFLYRNLTTLTRIVPTLDTHQTFQIFHPVMLIDESGRSPAPATRITAADLESGRWKANPEAALALGMSPESLNRHFRHYAGELKRRARLDWTVWPYHSMLGGIGHALVPSVAQALFFHELCRFEPVMFQIKGDHPLTEHYSVLGPEITQAGDGRSIGSRNRELVQMLSSFDRIVIAGQAKSHCVAWTVQDLIDHPPSMAPDLASRIYLLEDCTSAVVIPGEVDFADDADQAFRRFEEAGAHLVRSTDPMAEWPRSQKT